VIRLAQVERVIVVVVVCDVVRVMMVVVIVVIVIVVVIAVVVMRRCEREEVVRVLVVAAGVRVRDDARTGHRRRGKEGRENGDGDVWSQAHDVGVLTHRVRFPGSGRMRAPDRCRAACHLL